MEQFKIYCTPEQTKKALELGAPIEIYGDYVQTRTMVLYARNSGQLQKLKEELALKHKTIIEELVYNQPTAEEMIGWLEEQGLKFLIGMDDDDKFFFNIYLSEGYIDVRGCASRIESTLAAIDAALEYLTNNKK